MGIIYILDINILYYNLRYLRHLGEVVKVAVIPTIGAEHAEAIGFDEARLTIHATTIGCIANYALFSAMKSNIYIIYIYYIIVGSFYGFNPLRHMRHFS